MKHDHPEDGAIRKEQENMIRLKMELSVDQCIGMHQEDGTPADKKQ